MHSEESWILLIPAFKEEDAVGRLWKRKSLYVSSWGRIRLESRFLPTFVHGKTYLGVCFHGKRKYVHHIVAEAFLPTKPSETVRTT